MFTTALDFRSKNGLSIVQFATANQDSFQYVSSERAIKDKAIEVKEVSQSGSVNSLIVLNHSDHFVFMMDGDILVGAKQNRVVNTSVLLAPQSKTSVPVSCVEQGRWNHVSPAFSSADYTAPSSLRSEKAKQVKESLKMKRGFSSDQGMIWADVVSFQESTGVRSNTSNLSDVYENKRHDFEETIKEFKSHPEANGMSVFLGKELIVIDAFNRKDVFQEYFAKILRGVALDAHAKKKTAVASEAEAKYRTQEFFDGFESLAFESYEGVGVGEENRFGTDTLNGFALNYDGHLIHLTALRNEKKHRQE